MCAYSVLDCYNLFSGVKFRIRSFWFISNPFNSTLNCIATIRKDSSTVWSKFYKGKGSIYKDRGLEECMGCMFVGVNLVKKYV